MYVRNRQRNKTQPHAYLFFGCAATRCWRKYLLLCVGRAYTECLCKEPARQQKQKPVVCLVCCCAAAQGLGRFAFAAPPPCLCRAEHTGQAVKNKQGRVYCFWLDRPALGIEHHAVHEAVMQPQEHALRRPAGPMLAMPCCAAAVLVQHLTNRRCRQTTTMAFVCFSLVLP